MTNNASKPAELPARRSVTPASTTSRAMPCLAARILPTIMFVAWLLSVTGCATDSALTADERHELSDPPATIATDVGRLQPGVAGYIREAEQDGLRQGRPLSTDELKLAAEIGVAQPELVRIVVAGKFPLPSDAALATELKSRLGLGSTATGGLTLGHAIFITPEYAGKRWLLAHELTHVRQFEQIGIDRFAHDYLVQLFLVGYARAPIEESARMNEHLGRE
jgi:hypothetical protein